MSTLLPKSGVQVPAGNEIVSRAFFTSNWNAQDANLASQLQADQPLYLKSVTYDSTNGRYALVFGYGLIRFPGVMYTFADNTTYYVNSPITNTTYHIYVGSDGAMHVNTTGGTVAGWSKIWQIAVGTTLTTLTITDWRGQEPTTYARGVEDQLNTHAAAADPHPQYALDTDLTPARVGAVQNAGNVPALQQGTEAARPAPSLANKVYWATDTGHWWLDTGSAWTLLAMAQTTIVPFTNVSGTTLATGDLVTVDTASATAATVTSSTTSDDQKVAGVVVVGGNNGQIVFVATGGYVGVCAVASAVTKGAFLHQSTTARRAEAQQFQTGGTFGMALAAVAGAGTIPALIKGGGGGGTQNLITYDNASASGPTVTLPQVPAPNGVVSVEVNGQGQMPGTDYTIAGQVITFSATVYPGGLNNDAVHVVYLTTSTFNTGVFLQHDETTLAPGATTFSLSATPVGTPNVTRGGVTQYRTKNHFTLSGNVITFAEPIATGEDGIVSADYYVTSGGAGDAGTLNGFRAVSAANAAANPGTLVATDPATGQFPSSVFPAASSSVFHEEFLPTPGVTTITVSGIPNIVLNVARDGVIQSAADGHYTRSGNVFTFADSFDGTTRVVITYIVGLIVAGDANTLRGFAPSSAAAAQPGTLVATDSASGLLPASILPAIARNNLLSNGGFEVWQRGNGPFTGSNILCADQWTTYPAGTDTMSISKDTTNVDSVMGSRTSAACTFVLGTGAGGTGVYQALRFSTDTNQLNGRTIACSMRVRTATAGAVRIQVNSNGTGGAPTPGTTHPGDNTWRTLTVVYTIPADATFVSCSMSFLASCTAYLDSAMLVVGSNPVDYYPLHPADELVRCLRYYETLVNGPVYPIIGMNYSVSATQGPWRFRAIKPVTPTYTVINPTSWQVMDAGGAMHSVTTASNTGLTSGEVLAIFNVASGLVNGYAALIYAGATGQVAAEANP